MVWKLTNDKQRDEIGKVYQKLFNLLDSNSYDQKEVEKLIQDLENLGVKKTNIKFNHRATVCANFVIEVINEICKTNIPIVRSFEKYEEYIKLLSIKQKEELQKIEERLNLDEKKKKEIYGIHIFKEIIVFFQFKEVKNIISNSVIVYFGNTFGKNLPEHVGFLLDNGLVVSKFGIIDEIFLHPIDHMVGEINIEFMTLNQKNLKKKFQNISKNKKSRPFNFTLLPWSSGRLTPA